MAIWMVRHGETEWSISGQHTGSTDIPLTPDGRLQAAAIGKLLAGRRFDHVFLQPDAPRARDRWARGVRRPDHLHEGLLEFDYGELRVSPPGRSGRPIPDGSSSVTAARAAGRPSRWPSVSTP